MSVRMALAKLCACACGGAIVGGGAVHVVERQQPRPAVLKGLKQTKARPIRVAQHRVLSRKVTRTTTCTPGTTTTTVTLPDPPRYAAVDAYRGGPGAGAPLTESGYGATPVVYGGSAGGGFFGGFFGGGGSGGTFVTSTGGTITPPATSTGSTGGETPPVTSTGGQTPPVTSTGSTGGETPPTTSSSTGGDTPHEVPAPPVLFLFAAAAGALVLRRRFARTN